MSCSFIKATQTSSPPAMPPAVNDVTAATDAAFFVTARDAAAEGEHASSVGVEFRVTVNGVHVCRTSIEPQRRARRRERRRRSRGDVAVTCVDARKHRPEQ
jgi:hypothetical protein